MVDLMAPVSWIRFFPGDWRGSATVGGMSGPERIVYFELLMLEASGGPFRWDPERISRQVRLTVAECTSAWPAIRGCFSEMPDGRWTNAKMAGEVSRGEAHGAAQAERARTGWNKRRAMPGHPPGICPGDATPTPTPSKKKNQKGAARPAVGLAREAESALPPDGLPLDAWARWLAYLWQRKKPTAIGLALHRKKLAALVAKRGAAAAVAFLESSMLANAQGITDWAYDRAMDGEAKAGPKPPVDIEAHYRRLNEENLDPVMVERERRRKAAGA